jgi:TPR repeat protein
LGDVESCAHLSSLSRDILFFLLEDKKMPNLGEKKGLLQSGVLKGVELENAYCLYSLALDRTEKLVLIDNFSLEQTFLLEINCLFERAYKAFLKIRKDFYAQFYLGKMNFLALGRIQNYRLSFKWFQRAAIQGHARSQLALFFMLRNGVEGIQKDPILAEKWLNKFIQQILPSKKIHQDVLIFDDEDFSNKPLLVIKTNSEIQKDTSIYDDYLLINSFEITTKMDPNLVIKAYSRIAELGDAVFQSKIGFMFLTGTDFPKNLDLAYKWFLESSKQNNPDSLYYLGIMHLMDSSVPGNDASAFIFIERAALLNHPEAQYKTGIMYELGTGVPENFEKAFEWYEKAAVNGIPSAEYRIGVFLISGRGVTKDIVGGTYWIEKAAKHGVALAQFALSQFYFNGLVVGTQNIKLGLRWLRKAAKQGLALAQLYLGLHIFNNENVRAKKKKGLYWIQKAAKKGVAEAQFSLYHIYNDGINYPRNEIKAIKWLRKAAQQGLSEAVEQLKLIIH